MSMGRLLSLLLYNGLARYTHVYTLAYSARGRIGLCKQASRPYMGIYKLYELHPGPRRLPTTHFLIPPASCAHLPLAMRVPALLEQWALGLVGGVMAVDLAFDLPVVLDAASPAAVARAVAYYKVMAGGRAARGDAVYVPPYAMLLDASGHGLGRDYREKERKREEERERERKRENERER